MAETRKPRKALRDASGRTVDEVGNTLDGMAEAQEEHLTQFRRQYPRLWNVSGDVARLFAELAQTCAFQVREVGLEGVRGSARFLLAADRSAHVSVITMARFQLQEAYPSIRRVLELVGYTWLTWQDPRNAQVWIDATENDEAHQRYMTSLRNKIRRALTELDQKLIGELEGCHRMTHSSHESLRQAVEEINDREKGQQRIHVHNFDVLLPDNSALLVETLVRTLRTFRVAQEGLAKRLLEGHQGRVAREHWKELSKPVYDDLEQQGSAVRRA